MSGERRKHLHHGLSWCMGSHDQETCLLYFRHYHPHRRVRGDYAGTHVVHPLAESRATEKVQGKAGCQGGGNHAVTEEVTTKRGGRETAPFPFGLHRPHTSAEKKTYKSTENSCNSAGM